METFCKFSKLAGENVLKILKQKLALNPHLDTFLFLGLWSGIYFIAEEDLEDCASADSRDSSNLYYLSDQSSGCQEKVLSR